MEENKNVELLNEEIMEEPTEVEVYDSVEDVNNDNNVVNLIVAGFTAGMVSTLAIGKISKWIKNRKSKKGSYSVVKEEFVENDENPEEE